MTRRPGHADDIEMDVRIARLVERVDRRHDSTITTRIDLSIRQGNGNQPKPPHGDEAPEFWRARSERPCRGCGASFMPRARADRYCEECKRQKAAAEKASEAESRRPGVPASKDDTVAAPPAPASPRPPLTVADNPYRAGDFTPVTAKRCECGARGEWPGRRCPPCKVEWVAAGRPCASLPAVIVEVEFKPRRKGRRRVA